MFWGASLPKSFLFSLFFLYIYSWLFLMAKFLKSKQMAECWPTTFSGLNLVLSLTEL